MLFLSEAAGPASAPEAERPNVDPAGMPKHLFDADQSTHTQNNTKHIRRRRLVTFGHPQVVGVPP